MNASTILLMLDRNRDALEELERAERIFSDNASLHYAKGVALQNVDRFDEAEHELLTATEMGSEDAAVALAMCYGQLGRFADQVRILSYAAQRSSAPYSVYLSLGYAQLAAGMPDKALASFDHSEATSPFVGEAAEDGTDLRKLIAEGRAQARRNMQPQ